MRYSDMVLGTTSQGVPVVRASIYELVGGPLDGSHYALDRINVGAWFQIRRDRWAWYVADGHVLRFVRLANHVWE